MILERRQNTEEPEEFLDITSEQLTALSDQQLWDLLLQLGVTPPQPALRQKMIDLVIGVAFSVTSI